jgi:hypothetical protein
VRIAEEKLIKIVVGGEEPTPVEHQKEHKIGDFARN